MRVADIAVVVPAYNVEPWIRETLRSIVEQDPRPREVVVVDDGSSDGTADAGAEVSGEIVVVRQGNRGPGAARNAGARLCSSEWILSLDADDVLLRGGLSAIEEKAREHPDAEVVNPSFRSMSGSPSTDTRLVYTRTDLWRVIVRNPFSGNVAMRRDAWLRHPYPEDLRACEDLLLWISILVGGGTIHRTSEPVIARRENRPGAATTNVQQIRRCRREVFGRTRTDPRLTLWERALLDYQMIRTSVGVMAASVRPRSGTDREP